MNNKKVMDLGQWSNNVLHRRALLQLTMRACDQMRIRDASASPAFSNFVITSLTFHCVLGFSPRFNMWTMNYEEVLIMLNNQNLSQLRDLYDRFEL